MHGHVVFGHELKVDMRPIWMHANQQGRLKGFNERVDPDEHGVMILTT